MLLPRLLLLFGIGFLIATLRGVYLHAQYWRRRRSALLLWPGPRVPFLGMQIGIAVALGLLLAYNLLFRRLPPPETLFGEAMMFVYYAYAVPMSGRIQRGFYRDGIWSDRGFVAYRRIDGLTWREGKDPTLLLAVGGATARSLVVPGQHYGAVRRLLRDLIANHAINLSGRGLDLGVKDEREDA